MNEKLCALVDMLDVAADQQTVKSALKNFCASIGYERFAYLQTEGSDVRTMNTYPNRWESAYLEESFFKVDPVVTDAKRRREAFFWSSDEWSVRGSSPVKNFRDCALEHGICSGLTIPVDGSFGSTIMLTFASEDRKKNNPSKFDAGRAAQAVLAVHYKLQMIDAQIAKPSSRILSARETMCLKWAAKGKSAPETAVLSGINPRTVQHYLDSARRKLDAATVPHLVAIAKDRGLI